MEPLLARPKVLASSAQELKLAREPRLEPNLCQKLAEVAASCRVASDSQAGNPSGAGRDSPSVVEDSPEDNLVAWGNRADSPAALGNLEASDNPADSLEAWAFRAASDTPEDSPWAG